MWNYREANGTTRQFTEKEVKKLFMAGVLLPSTPVWHPSMGDWLPASETDLAKLFPTSKQETSDRYKTTDNESSLPFEFADPSTRLSSLVRGLKVFIAGSVLLFLAIAYENATGLDDTSLDDMLYNLLLFPGFVLFLGGYFWSALGFMRWTKRVSINAHAISKRKLKYSPRFAMWSYIIPIVNCWIPLVAVSEIWNVSYQKVKRGVCPTKTVLHVWWGCYIVSSVFDRVIDKVEAANQYEPWLTLTSFVLNIAMGVYAIKLVTAVTSPQVEYAKELAPERDSESQSV